MTVQLRQGIEIVNIAQVQKKMANGRNLPLMKATFTPLERSYCQAKKMKWEHYASRYAVKCALCKALGRKPVRHLSLLEIKRLPGGRPVISVSATARRSLGLSRTCQVEISMSHDRQWAIGTVLVIEEDSRRPRGAGKGNV